MKEENKLIDFCLNTRNYLQIYSSFSTNNNFIIGEDEIDSFISLQSNAVSVNNLNFLKLISMIKFKEDNKFHIINLPKIMSYSLNDTTKILYTQIKNCFQIGKENFNQLNVNGNLNLESIEDLDLYIENQQNLNIPFILF